MVGYFDQVRAESAHSHIFDRVGVHLVLIRFAQKARVYTAILFGSSTHKKHTYRGHYTLA